jgi:phage shock protein PspC (stress-responsive transcriptional regulator)
LAVSASGQAYSGTDIGQRGFFHTGRIARYYDWALQTCLSVIAMVSGVSKAVVLLAAFLSAAVVVPSYPLLVGMALAFGQFSAYSGEVVR